MTHTPLTEDELKIIPHHSYNLPSKASGGLILCATCSQPWPCPTVRVVTELRTLRQAHAAALDEIRSWYGDRNLVAEAHSECRRELAAALETVRAAVEHLQGEASLWHDLYPAWLVYALLGEDAPAAKPFSKVNKVNMSRQYDAIRALVALAEGGAGK